MTEVKASNLRISHITTYTYRENVSFEAHRLMLRPRESREVRLIDHALTTDPPSDLSWAQDVFGNTAGVARFHDVAGQGNRVS